MSKTLVYSECRPLATLLLAIHCAKSQLFSLSLLSSHTVVVVEHKEQRGYDKRIYKNKTTIPNKQAGSNYDTLCNRNEKAESERTEEGGRQQKMRIRFQAG